LPSKRTSKGFAMASIIAEFYPALSCAILWGYD